MLRFLGYVSSQYRAIASESETTASAFGSWVHRKHVARASIRPGRCWLCSDIRADLLHVGELNSRRYVHQPFMMSIYLVDRLCQCGIAPNPPCVVNMQARFKPGQEITEDDGIRHRCRSFSRTVLKFLGTGGRFLWLFSCYLYFCCPCISPLVSSAGYLWIKSILPHYSSLGHLGPGQGVLSYSGFQDGMASSTKTPYFMWP